jgi:hypothetical protein
MRLDLRQPTLVIAGAWNPAIFSVEWIATHILGKKENEVLKLVQVVDATGNFINYYNETGLYTNLDRISLYCNDLDQATRAEDMAI